MLSLVRYCMWVAIFLRPVCMGQCPPSFTSPPRAGFELCCQDGDARFKGSFKGSVFVSKQWRQGLRGPSHASKERFNIFHATECILLSSKTSASQGELVISLRAER